MASIGSITLYAWRGRVRGVAPEVAVVAKPNSAGLVVLTSQPRPIPQEVETDLLVADAGLAALQASLDALEGTVTTAVDATMTSWSYCLVQRRMPVLCRWTSAGWLLRDRWTLWLKA